MVTRHALIACLVLAAPFAIAQTNPPYSTSASAARTTASTNSTCTGLGPFYWEIGDKTGAVTSASQGGSYTANSSMLIASASKWLFGAYLIEKRKGQLSAADLKALHMQTGYNNLNYNLCLSSANVDQCFKASSLTNGANNRYANLQDGYFYYNGGHFQKYADVDLGLGAKTTGRSDTATTLAQELASQLGTDFAFSFDSPQLAAGIRITPANYAIFLRKLLNKTLMAGTQLGQNPVCTNTVPTTSAAVCLTSHYTPIQAGEAWHYSSGHWVEDDAAVGDGAFSSPGAFGFYPWIDKSKTWYGLVAREVPITVNDLTPYQQSAKCGRLIRKAWLTGAPQ